MKKKMGDYRYKYRYQREYVFMREKMKQRNDKKLQVLGKSNQTSQNPEK